MYSNNCDVLKIIHICMCDPYAENWSYHRNISSIQNAIDGHKVFVITTRYAMDENGKGCYINEEPYKNKYGVKVIRLKNKLIHSRIIQSRLRLVNGLYKLLESIEPDIIMVHNPQFWSVFDVTKYKRNNPKVTLLVDSHADYTVSGRNFVSKYILNGIFSRFLMKANIMYFDKLYFITQQTKDFFLELFTKRIPENVIIPLGSRYYPVDEKNEYKSIVRYELNMDEDELLFVHSGKLDKRKKTDVLIKAFSKVKALKAKMLIFGSIPDNMTSVLYPLINADERIIFMGWTDSYTLAKYLCAADIYFQPGMHSITLQNALSCGTPAVVAPNTSYEEYFDNWQFVCDGEKDLEILFLDLSVGKYDLKAMSQSAYVTAEKYFDSRIFAKDMYETHYKRMKKGVKDEKRP